MFECPKCGAVVQDENSAYCPSCGAALKGEKPQFRYQYDQSQAPQGNHPYQRGEETGEKPMKWYKFVIYVQLFLAALGALYTAYTYITGLGLGGKEVRDLIYAVYPSMKGLMVVMGVVYILVAVAYIVVRQWLAHYKWRGVMALYVMYVVPFALNLIFVVGSSVILGQLILPGTLFSLLVGTVVGVVLNVIYFNKRRHLFQ